MADAPKRTSTPQPGIVKDFYAPSFQIEIEGLELSKALLGDIREVKVVMDFGKPTHFELSLDNWDDRRTDFKHIGSARKESKEESPLFDLGQTILIRMGYADQLFPMVFGQITTLEPRFPQSGPRTLSVSGLDGMFELMGSNEPFKYENKADWEIAQEVGGRHAIVTRVTKEGLKNLKVMQHGVDEAAFLNSLAQRIGFDFYFRMDPGTGVQTLIFAKSESFKTSKAPVYDFEWGKDLLRFDPKLDISDQVDEVIVNKSNPNDKKRRHEGRADKEDLNCGDRRSGPEVIKAARARVGESRKLWLVENEKVESQEEAKRLAVNTLRDRAIKYSTGSGQVIGFPKLRPGDNVRIEGVGLRFGGFYQVSHVEHTFNSSGYLTSFNVRRVHDGGPASEPEKGAKKQ